MKTLNNLPHAARAQPRTPGRGAYHSTARQNYHSEDSPYGGTDLKAAKGEMRRRMADITLTEYSL